MDLKEDASRLSEIFETIARELPPPPGETPLADELLRFAVELDPAKRAPAAFMIAENAAALFPVEPQAALDALRFIIVHSGPQSRIGKYALALTLEGLENWNIHAPDLLHFILRVPSKGLERNNDYQRICKIMVERIDSLPESPDHKITLLQLIAHPFDKAAYPRIHGAIQEKVQDIKNPQPALWLNAANG